MKKEKKSNKKPKYVAHKTFEPMKQDETKEPCLICDLDGTLAIIGARSVYSAINCDLVDFINPPVAETVKLYYQAGHKIIFCSGRMEKDRAPSVRFIEKHLPKMEYQLFMRQDKDVRADHIVKEKIFNEHIKDKYWVKFCLDDRDSIVKLWRSMGLTCFQVAYGNF